MHLDSKKLQEIWSSSSLNNEVFDFLDNIGVCIEKILSEADFSHIDTSIVSSIIQEDNKKIKENHHSILTGFYFLSSINNKLFIK